MSTTAIRCHSFKHWLSQPNDQSKSTNIARCLHGEYDATVCSWFVLLRNETNMGQLISEHKSVMQSFLQCDANIHSSQNLELFLYGDLEPDADLDKHEVRLNAPRAVTSVGWSLCDVIHRKVWPKSHKLPLPYIPVCVLFDIEGKTGLVITSSPK